MVGNFEAPDIKNFTHGAMNRKASIRVPQGCVEEGKGYYEDRRPASNCDSYIVPTLIFSATCLNGEYIKEIVNAYNNNSNRNN